MQTLHIFDEFASPCKTDEERHQKRTKLEPLVFDILKEKYLPTFRAFWDQHTPPRNADKAVVIVERRIHENLEFVIKNAAYMCTDWSIVIVCSDVNLPYLKHITGKTGNHIAFLPLFEGSPGRDEARTQYNYLLTQAAFYEEMPCETLLFLQTDSYILRPIPESMLNYYFMAAPCAWDNDMMAGGASLRRRSAMIDICTRYKEQHPGEDVFICCGAKALNYKTPPFEEAVQYIVESCITDVPIVTHQWWTYFYSEMDDAPLFFEALLTCQLNQII